MKKENSIYGLIAEFETQGQLLEAAASAREHGYRRMDGFTPFPVDGLPEALGRPRSRIPLIVLLGGISGGLGGYFMQWYANVISYPINVAGRPLNTWPAFIPITFELTVLGAALSAFFGALLLNKLPQPYHPVFNVPDFERASVDRFFLCIEAGDPQFDLKNTRSFLDETKALKVSEVEL